jgi:thiosulfate reductase/polysulfide reductase chain A
MHTFTRTVNNKWPWELKKENHVWINTEVAKRLNIKDGEYVVLENQDGIRSNKVIAKVTERIRKDCVYLPHGFGQMSKLLSRAYMRGADDQGLITRYKVDPISGVTGMRVNFVKIIKEA